jgi:hypothetical protein
MPLSGFAVWARCGLERPHRLPDNGGLLQGIARLLSQILAIIGGL